MFSAFSPNIYQSARETICCHLVLFGLSEILKLYTYMKMHLQIFAQLAFEELFEHRNETMCIEHLS